jgi:hypothetical protein
MRKIYSTLLLLFTICGVSQTVIQAEYFWDTDPGVGNGIALQAIDGDFNQALETVFNHNTTTLPSTGNHVIGIRIKGQDGNWSVAFRKTLKIVANNNSNAAVKIIQAEYFWDNDPGQGNGISMIAFDGNFNQALESVMNNTSSLPSVGNHTLGIRVKAADGNWGSTFRKVFRVTNNNNSNITVKITQAEYFWDNDPGAGNGNTLLAFDGNFNQALESVINNDVTLPTIGNHTIGIRVKAADGNWGTTFRKVFRVTNNNNSNNTVKITQAEYFWDTDPGQGNGTTLLAFDGNFNQALESVINNNVTLPNIGNHTIGIRVKADDGIWGTTFKRVFRVTENNNSNNTVKITQAEYFWDTDPGQGNGTTLLAFDGNFNQALESVINNNVTLPNIGNHTIGIRVKAADGIWGTTFKKVFRVTENNNSNNTVKITQAEYFWNADPGQGNGNTLLAFDGNFNQAIESIIATNAVLPSAGMNLLNIRVKAEDGNWGTVYSKVVGLDITYNNQIVLTSPANGSTLVPLNSSFVWEQLTGAGTYEYQCATNATFNTIVQTGFVSGLTTPFSLLATNTTYYWRVRANVSGNVSLWSAVWSFTTNSTLTNPDYEISSEIELFPNPVQKILNIKANQIIKEINVFDMLGKKVIVNQADDKKQINVASLVKGMYIISVECEDDKTFSLKFIKE